jgi:hypothetical protein
MSDDDAPRVDEEFIERNLAVREQVIAGLLQFDLEDCGNYGTKLQLEKDFLEWSLFIVINEYFKLNVSILLEDGYIATMLYETHGDGFHPDYNSSEKHHFGDLQTQLNSIAAVAQPLIWWKNRA